MSVSDERVAAHHYVTAGLETGQLDLGSLIVREVDDARTLFAPLLEQRQHAGLLERQGDRVDLTIAGRF